MRLACLFSGGKDSTYALHIAHQAGHDIACLVSVKPENNESFMYHVPNIEWTKLQAQAMKIPLVIVSTPGRKEAELNDLKKVLMELKKTVKIEGVVTGAVYSTYQASRIQKICAEAGLYCFNPIWQTNVKSHWHELLLNGLEIVLVSVAAQGLDKRWLGKKMDEKALHELVALEKKHGVSPIGEGGEFESFVINAPLFQKKIQIEKFKDVWVGLQGTRTITKATLVEKGNRGLEQE
jgi:asparagine synthase (glutamine-hydrolysing)